MASGSSYEARLLSPVTSSASTVPARYSRAAASSRCARYGEGFPSHSPAPKTTATGSCGTSASDRTRPPSASRNQVAGTRASTHTATLPTTSRRHPARVLGSRTRGTARRNRRVEPSAAPSPPPAAARPRPARPCHPRM